MAIIRKRFVQPKIVEIGRIYKGSPKQERKKKNGETYIGYGEDLDHFRFEPAERLKDMPSTDGTGTLYEELLQRWEDLESHRSIRVRFASDNPEQAFNWSNEVWSTVGGSEKCVRRCDGDTVSQYIQEVNGKKVLCKGAIPCSAVEGQSDCPQGCKPTGRLSFILPDLMYPGMVMLTTHSVYDIEEIRSNLEAFRGMKLSAMPFRLCRTHKPCNWNKPDGSVLQQKKWLCHLEVDPMFGMLALQGRSDRYQAELVGEIVEEPLPALPASKVIIEKVREDFSGNPTWIRFQREMAKARRNGDAGYAQTVANKAFAYIEEGSLPQDAREAVTREWEQTIEAIGQLGVAG